jgi:hypothetical protein
MKPVCVFLPFQRLLVCRLLMLGKGVSHTDTKHTGVNRELSFSSQHHLPTTSGLVLVLLGG